MSDDKFVLDTALAFDRQKQAAVVGWCLLDERFCKACARAVNGDWFTSSHLRMLYNAFMALYQSEGRRVTKEELLGYQDFKRKEEADQNELGKTLENALKQTEIYHCGLLRKEMDGWLQAVTFYQAVEKAGRSYNAKRVQEAWSILDDASLFRATSTFEDGANQGFLPASERILKEEDERMAQAPLVMNYGVEFLQDSLGGIIPNDLIVLGAKTGSGKTALSTCISMATASVGHPAHYFALEAENMEIERRIKYGLLSSNYYKGWEPGMPQISYTDWRMGKLVKVLGPLERRLQGEFVESVRNLHTLYRNEGTFDLRALEKSLLKIVDKTRLIVLDHLHYVDTEDNDNENLAYKRVIKLIRNIVLKYSVPVIVVAHLRKTIGGRNGQGLISSVEDFHGTSDVPKIATTCIMLGPCFDHAAPEQTPYAWPTYMGVVKSRLEGGRTRFTGLTYFNPRTNAYEKVYQIGKMDGLNKEWSRIFGVEIPYWANSASRGDEND